MERQKPWRELFSREEKINTRPPLQATWDLNGKLHLKVPRIVTNQIVKRGRLSLIGKVEGARPNIDDVRKWTKLKWKLKGSLDIIALPNDYLLFVFRNEEDQNDILSSGWFIGNMGLFLERRHPGFDLTKAQILRAPI